MTTVTIYHNILWSKYKGAVFSSLALLALTKKSPLNIEFVQIAETENDRVGLSPVDKRYHTYSYKVLFKGSYEKVASWRLIATLFLDVWQSSAKLIIIPGYYRVEFWAMLFAALLRGKQRAVFCDSTAYDRSASRIKSLAKRVFLGLCDGYFGYGQRSREYLLMHGARPNTIFQRCQAAALPFNYGKDEAFADRLRYVSAPDMPRFLYVGRLAPEKNLLALLSAFHKIWLTKPNASLVLVGSGPMQIRLQHEAAQAGMAQAVLFAGGMDIDHLAVEYTRATCLVLPSLSEPWGLVANEALSYGCPLVVSWACGCVPELVVEGFTGYAFDPKNPDEMTERMAQIINDLGPTEVVARRCIDHISEFSAEKAAAQILDGCHAILTNRIPVGE